MIASIKTKVVPSTQVLGSKTGNLFPVFFVELPPIKENETSTNVL
jgi:hypothetical protein